jgi:hypothetical protein
MSAVRIEQSRTRDFVRATIARLIHNGNDEVAAEYCRKRWGLGSPASMICSRSHDLFVANQLADEGLIRRAATPNTEVSDTGIGTADPAATQFFNVVDEGTIIGQIGAIEVGFHKKYIAGLPGSATFVGESKSIPVAVAELAGSEIGTAKAAGIFVVPNELLSAVGPLREQMFERRLIDANRFVADSFFIDPAHSPSAGLPTAVTYGAPSAASTGDVAQDLELLIENFGGDLSTASIVTSPWVATRIALQKDTSGWRKLARSFSVLTNTSFCPALMP